MGHIQQKLFDCWIVKGRFTEVSFLFVFLLFRIVLHIHICIRNTDTTVHSMERLNGKCRQLHALILKYTIENTQAIPFFGSGPSVCCVLFPYHIACSVNSFYIQCIFFQCMHMHIAMHIVSMYSLRRFITPSTTSDVGFWKCKFDFYSNFNSGSKTGCSWQRFVIKTPRN